MIENEAFLRMVSQNPNVVSVEFCAICQVILFCDLNSTYCQYVIRVSLKWFKRTRFRPIHPTCSYISLFPVTLVCWQWNCIHRRKTLHHRHHINQIINFRFLNHWNVDVWNHRASKLRLLKKNMLYHAKYFFHYITVS